MACDYLLPARRHIGQLTPASLLLDLLPSAEALAGTTLALREYSGLLVYRLRGWAD